MITDVIKVLDIGRDAISTGLLYALRGNCTYQDCDGNEDMYSVIVEEKIGAKLEPYESNELGEILGLCEEKDCAYFRIISI